LTEEYFGLIRAVIDRTENYLFFLAPPKLLNEKKNPILEIESVLIGKADIFITTAFIYVFYKSKFMLHMHIITFPF